MCGLCVGAFLVLVLFVVVFMTELNVLKVYRKLIQFSELNFLGFDYCLLMKFFSLLQKRRLLFLRFSI